MGDTNKQITTDSQKLKIVDVELATPDTFLKVERLIELYNL